MQKKTAQESIPGATLRGAGRGAVSGGMLGALLGGIPAAIAGGAAGYGGTPEKASRLEKLKNAILAAVAAGSAGAGTGALTGAAMGAPLGAVTRAAQKQGGAELDIAYEEGFVQKCAEVGVDPEELLKQSGIGSAIGRKTPEILRQLWRYIKPSRIRKIPTLMRQGFSSKLPARHQEQALKGLIGALTLPALGTSAVLGQRERLKNVDEKEGTSLDPGYVEGFIGRCDDIGIDPEELLKQSQLLGNIGARTGVGQLAGALGRATSGIQGQDVKRVAGSMSKGLGGLAGNAGKGLSGLSGIKRLFSGR